MNEQTCQGCFIINPKSCPRSEDQPSDLCLLRKFTDNEIESVMDRFHGPPMAQSQVDRIIRKAAIANAQPQEDTQ